MLKFGAKIGENERIQANIQRLLNPARNISGRNGKKRSIQN